jgi:nicotinamidase-related amidase
MKPAIIVVDMLKDNLRSEYPISARIRSILPSVQKLLKKTRSQGHQIIFACDSYRPDDFIFQGKMKPHAIEGTSGAEVMGELSPTPQDIILRKRRFSAFFQTGLEEMLRAQGIDTVVVVGVTTHFCVLMTALDAICHDFRVIVLEDCCASHRAEIDEWIVRMYTRSPLDPLFRFMQLREFWPLLEASSRIDVANA